ncbi:MAG: hypothetical protein Q9222_004990 [Ikaeria aurantiellina]
MTSTLITPSINDRTTASDPPTTLIVTQTVRGGPPAGYPWNGARGPPWMASQQNATTTQTTLTTSVITSSSIATPGPTIAKAAISSTSKPSSSSDTVKKDVGIAIGVSGAWLFIGLLTWWILRRRRAKRKNHNIPSIDDQKPQALYPQSKNHCNQHEAEAFERKPELHPVHRVEVIGREINELPAG